jgi:hypothetical protein
MQQIARKKTNEERKHLESEVLWNKISRPGCAVKVFFSRVFENCLLLVMCKCMCAYY